MKMKNSIISASLLAFVAVFWWSAVRGETAKEDVYVYNMQGDVYLKTQKGKETQLKKLCILEVIPAGSVLDIKDGASVSLRRPNCGIVTRKSSYTVDMADFQQQDRSMSHTVAKALWDTLKWVACPACKSGAMDRMVVRGGTLDKPDGQSEGLWPPDRMDILTVGENITFEWGAAKGCRFVFEIWEDGEEAVLYSETTTANRIEVPLEKLQKAEEFVTYKWAIMTEETGEMRKAVFGLSSREQTEDTLQNLHNMLTLLPAEADDAVKCRLQANYLCHEGKAYNARQWIETNRVYQH